MAVCAANGNATTAPTKRNVKKSEKRWLNEVAQLGCLVCKRMGYGETPAEIHHIRSGQGWGRASHYQTIPLCPEHHRGRSGVHGLGTKGFVRHYGYTEQDLLDQVYQLIGEPDEI